MNTYEAKQTVIYSFDEIRFPSESTNVEHISMNGKKSNSVWIENNNFFKTCSERDSTEFPSQLSIFKKSNIFRMKVILIPRIIQNKVLLKFPNCVHQIQFGSHRFFQSHIS